jgi:5,10-methylenetetrahydromethanopterin reductase
MTSHTPGDARNDDADDGAPVLASGWAFWIHALRPVAELVKLAQLAEDLGAAALLVADEGTDRDLYVTLAAVAVATRHILLVPAITNPHSRHPVATAAALASLEELAPNRVIAGLGAGGSLVFDPMGIRPARPFSALSEAVDVIDRLLAGEVVDHQGQFSTSRAAIGWSPRRLPIAIAGRGPRVEQLGAERADWVILSGKAVAEVPAVVARLRSGHPGRPAVIWNPGAAWRPEHVNEVRSHFAYMTVDTPPDERRALGVTDEQVAHLREVVHRDGPEAAAHLVPDQITHRYAIIGDREQVIARLAEAQQTVRPELIAFGAHEYSADFVRETAEIAARAGLRALAPGELQTSAPLDGAPL